MTFSSIERIRQPRQANQYRNSNVAHILNHKRHITSPYITKKFNRARIVLLLIELNLVHQGKDGFNENFDTPRKKTTSLLLREYKDIEKGCRKDGKLHAKQIEGNSA